MRLKYEPASVPKHISPASQSTGKSMHAHQLACEMLQSGIQPSTPRKTLNPAEHTTQDASSRAGHARRKTACGVMGSLVQGLGLPLWGWGPGGGAREREKGRSPSLCLSLSLAPPLFPPPSLSVPISLYFSLSLSPAPPLSLSLTGTCLCSACALKVQRKASTRSATHRATSLHLELVRARHERGILRPGSRWDARHVAHRSWFPDGIRNPPP